MKIDAILVNKENSLLEAIEILDRTGLTILLLIDNEGKLIRTITDGDIRRQILKGKSFSNTLKSIKYVEPIVAKEGCSAVEILALMNKNGINQVPVIDDEGKPKYLHLRSELNSRIPLSIPHLGGDELKYVQSAFDTNWVAPLGPNIDGFEKEISEYVGIKHTAALSSGTAAIHLALILLGVQPGDYVICSSFTFIASVNPVIYQRATPIFVDSEPNTWNMSPIALKQALSSCRKQGKKVKAIVVAQVYGMCADMEKIMQIANEYEVPVIEDAAESLGSTYKGKKVGTMGSLGVYSFNGNKIITTSSGGMLVSEDEQLIKKARFLSTQAREDVMYYEHKEVGYNYRMSNVLAGIGRGQLRVIEDRINARRGIFTKYKSSLVSKFIDWIPTLEGYSSNCWLSVLTFNEKFNKSPKEIIEYMLSKGIELRHLWKPMHKQPLFKGTEYFKHGNDSYCDYLFLRGVCLPSSSNMSESQQDRVNENLHCLLK